MSPTPLHRVIRVINIATGVAATAIAAAA